MVDHLFVLKYLEVLAFKFVCLKLTKKHTFDQRYTTCMENKNR